MRAHTGSGTKPTLAFAPGPTAAGLVGNRVRGSAPACGRGGSLVLPGGVARGGGGAGFGVLRLDVDVGPTGNVRRLLVVVVVCAVDVAAVGVRAEAVAVSIATGGPAPQLARTMQVSTLAVVVALVVLLRGMVRSVRLGSRWWPQSAMAVVCRRCVRFLHQTSFAPGFLMPKLQEWSRCWRTIVGLFQN